MLKELAIRDLGVIAQAKVELSQAFTVITGETGAGKTMILTALDQLTGGKSDPGLVRGGAGRSTVSGIWELEVASPSRQVVTDAGGNIEDDEIVVTRVVQSQGRSRASLGGVAVPAASLSEAVGPLVAVHGQSDQLRLRSSAHQRDMLDTFAGPEHLAALADYQATYGELSEAIARLDRLRHLGREATREAASLTASLAEINHVAPRAGEEAELTALAERLSNAEELRAAASGALSALASDGDGETPDGAGALALADAARRLLELAGARDPALAALADRVRQITFQLSDLAGELAAYVEALDADPSALESVHERRAALNGLLRKYGPDAEAVLAWAAEAEARLIELDGGADRIAELTALIASLTQRAVEQAAGLSKARTAAGRRLNAAVNTELAGLAMPGAHFEVQFSNDWRPGVGDTGGVGDLAGAGCTGAAGSMAAAGKTGMTGKGVSGGTAPPGGKTPPGDRSTIGRVPGPHGGESVEFWLTAHPGAPARPLGKGASGGELSRVMLALEVSLAEARDRQLDDVTLVFDEIDAGVGGKAAVEVGRRLARLARGAQVIVVTHLAQVAAFADRHLVVVKETGPDGGVTEAQTVAGEARLRELARMLAGQEGSASAQAHAAELLALRESPPNVA